MVRDEGGELQCAFIAHEAIVEDEAVAIPEGFELRFKGHFKYNNEIAEGRKFKQNYYNWY